jgi:hypothetical protein
MVILVDHSAETVLTVHGEAFNLVGSKRLGPCPRPVPTDAC